MRPAWLSINVTAIAIWLAVKDINTEMHETLDSITTYQGEGPPGRRRWSDSCLRLSWASLVGITVEECGRLLNTASTVQEISAHTSVSAPWSVGRMSASAAELESNLRLLAAD